MQTQSLYANVSVGINSTKRSSSWSYYACLYTSFNV